MGNFGIYEGDPSLDIANFRYVRADIAISRYVRVDIVVSLCPMRGILQFPSEIGGMFFPLC
jgi:hypothetical protein